MKLKRFSKGNFTREPAKQNLTMKQIRNLPGYGEALVPAHKGASLAVHVAVGGTTALAVHPGNPTDGVGYVDYSSTPIVAAGGPSCHDVHQWQVEDCYILAEHAMIALYQPAVILERVKQDAPGTYRVCYELAAGETWVYEDGKLPGNGVIVSDGCIWPGICEKGWCYGRTGANTYASINFGYVQFGTMGYSYQMYTPNAATWAAVAVALAKKMPVIFGTNATIPAGVPIIPLHMHGVTAILANGDINAYNPWGFDGAGSDSDPNDGVVTMTQAQANSGGIAYVAIATGYTPTLTFVPPVVVTPTPVVVTPAQPTGPVSFSFDAAFAVNWQGCKVESKAVSYPKGSTGNVGYAMSAGSSFDLANGTSVSIPAGSYKMTLWVGIDNITPQADGFNEAAYEVAIGNTALASSVFEEGTSSSYDDYRPIYGVVTFATPVTGVVHVKQDSHTSNFALLTLDPITS